MKKKSTQTDIIPTVAQSIPTYKMDKMDKSSEYVHPNTASTGVLTDFMNMITQTLHPQVC